MISTIGAITTSVLVIVAFASAYLNFPHGYAVAVLFVPALGSFSASLVNLARDTGISLHEMGEHR